MITPSFSLTATERVLPKLALDFTTASLDARVTFTRTTDATQPATYVNSSGYVTNATNNQPRFDYNPVTLVCKGLLIEESRTNLCTYSADFRSTAQAGSARPWVPSGLTTGGASGTGPDGTNSATAFIPSNGVNGASGCYRNNLSTAQQAISVYVKRGNKDYAVIYGVGAGTGTAWFNINTGTVGTIGAACSNPSITAVGNSWWRISVIISASAGVQGLYCSDADNSLTCTGDGTTAALYYWGAQWETGAFATSYIPTTSTALTRNADVATMTGTNFSDWWNNTEGTFVFSSYASPNTATVRYLEAQTGTNAVRFYNSTAGSNKVTFNVDNAGSSQCFIAANVTPNTIIKVSGAFKANNFAAGLNGTLTGTDLSGTAPGAISTLYIGDTGSGGRNICTWMRKIYFYPQALTNAEVTAFSKQ